MSKQFWAHLGTGLAAVAVSGLVTTAAIKQQPHPFAVAVTAPTQGKWSWGVLSDVEQKSAATAIGNLDRREVEIFCGSSACDDLAQDIDEVMDQTHAASTVRRPVLDIVGMAGIGIMPADDQAKAIAKAITEATGGRIPVSVIDQPVKGGGLQIVIASKPRH